MTDHFPRTTTEFRQHGRLVVVRCDACDRSRAVDPEVLMLEFGEDFDVYAGMKDSKHSSDATSVANGIG